MELNKKSKFAENVKNKILNLQDAIERNNNIEQFIKDYESMKYGLIDTDISLLQNRLLYQKSMIRILTLHRKRASLL